MLIAVGSTNVSLPAYFVDDDGGTAPGEPTTGKLFSDIETGGSASYMRQGSARTDFTLVTLASASAGYTVGGFILVDDTNMPGNYRVDVPDAAFATGVDFVIIHLVMASANNSIMRPLLISLTETSAGVADAVWDELTTDHIAVNTFGQRLSVLESGTAVAATASTITLDAGSSELADFYNDTIIVITAGTGAGQARFINDYAVTTNVATVNANWITTPSTDSVYYIIPFGTIPGASAPTAAQVADAVWDEVATPHQTGGTFGQAIGDPGANTETMYDAVVTDAAGTNVAADVIAVKAETALIVADTGELQTDNIPGTLAALNDITAADVWAVDATSQQTQGTFGQAIGDPVADTTTIYQAVATDAAGDNVAIDIVAVKAETALIVADTGELQTDDVPTLIAAVQSDTDDLQTQIGTAGAGLTDLGGMSTGMKAEVESEANDALVAQKLDHLVAVADADDPVNNSIIAKLANSGATADWSVYVNTTDSLMAIRDRGDVAWTGAGAATLLQNTTITGLSSQTVFNLTAGSADNGAYVGAMAVIEDSATSTQKAVGLVKAYTGATKTITLDADPGVFTMANGDTIDIIATSRALPEFRPDAAGGLPVSDAGGLDLDVMNTNVNDIETDLANGTDGLGALKALIDTVNTDLANGTDGLGALKTLIDTVNTDLSNGTDGLGALKALIDTLDTVADGIKGITDQFVFTKANEVDANTLSINGATVVGDGNATPWDGA